mmetsp:Transcript_15296/g.33059  ORF Transcript_15296/g.33059 Transcript_15296/m.33059 type:complete len:225 (+) Transcript_15296:210-884(+)
MLSSPYLIASKIRKTITVPPLLEQSRNTSLRVNVEDRLGQQRCHTKLHKFLIRSSLRCARNGIQDNTLLQLGIGNPLISRSRQEPVGCKCKDTSGTLGYKNVCSLTQCTGSINHIINDDTIAILHISDKIHLIHRSSTSTLLNNHGNSNILPSIFVGKPLLKFLRTVHSSSIWTNNDRIVQVLSSKVVNAHDPSLEVVHWDTRSEESLDLTTMQINCNDTIHTH